MEMQPHVCCLSFLAVLQEIAELCFSFQTVFSLPEVIRLSLMMSSTFQKTIDISRCHRIPKRLNLHKITCNVVHNRDLSPFLLTYILQKVPPCAFQAFCRHLTKRYNIVFPF